MADRFIPNPTGLHELLISPTGPVSRFMIRTGTLVSNDAKVRCPVATTRLRSSIQPVEEPTSQGMVIKVGSNVEYARFVHNGTKDKDGGVRMAARPFLKDALDDVIGKMR